MTQAVLNMTDRRTTTQRARALLDRLYELPNFDEFDADEEEALQEFFADAKRLRWQAGELRRMNPSRATDYKDQLDTALHQVARLMVASLGVYVIRRLENILEEMEGANG